MANTIYTGFKDNLAKGNHAFGTDTYYAMLLGAHTISAAHTSRNDVQTNETTGTAYSANGKTIGTVTVTPNGTTIEVDAPDVTWAASTISAQYAVIYQFNGGAATADLLVAVWDFAGTESSSNGNFTLQFAAAGFITL